MFLRVRWICRNRGCNRENVLYGDARHVNGAPCVSADESGRDYDLHGYDLRDRDLHDHGVQNKPFQPD